VIQTSFESASLQSVNRKDCRNHRYQPSLGIALWSQFATPGGFHRYEPVKLFQELLPGNAVFRLRFEPSSRTTLIGEQPNPWDLLQPQDVMSRHRGAKLLRRCGLLGGISLLSPEYLLSVERWPFHTEPPDHYDLLSHLLDMSVSQLSTLMPLHSVRDDRPR
jgi:hypothetical protein